MKNLKQNTNRNDVVMTPEPLAKRLIEHFQPFGKILEPCIGEGAFYNNLVNAEWCEITKGKDFMEYHDKVDWIITNPPWSKIRPFLQHSMELSEDIVFLTALAHLWFKARLRDINNAGFGIREIVLFDTPKNFPQGGFQIGAFHIKKNYMGDIKFTNWCSFQENNEGKSK
jgi:hypothetical protein